MQKIVGLPFTQQNLVNGGNTLIGGQRSAFTLAGVPTQDAL